MKRIAALAAIVAFALTGFATTAVSESTKQKSTQLPPPAHCMASAFRPWSARVWAPERWRRGMPPDKTLEAKSHRVICAGPGNRAAMRKIWHRDKAAFYKYRAAMLWREEFKPFVYPSGKRWAVPYPIAVCESSENYFVGPSGAYGLIPPFPQYMSPKAQDETAHRLYEESGEGPWAPFETSCAYR